MVARAALSQVIARLHRNPKEAAGVGIDTAPIVYKWAPSLEDVGTSGSALETMEARLIGVPI